MAASTAALPCACSWLSISCCHTFSFTTHTRCAGDRDSADQLRRGRDGHQRHHHHVAGAPLFVTLPSLRFFRFVVPYPCGSALPPLCVRTPRVHLPACVALRGRVVFALLLRRAALVRFLLVLTDSFVLCTHTGGHRDFVLPGLAGAGLVPAERVRPHVNLYTSNSSVPSTKIPCFALRSIVSFASRLVASRIYFVVSVLLLCSFSRASVLCACRFIQNAKSNGFSPNLVRFCDPTCGQHNEITSWWRIRAGRRAGTAACTAPCRSARKEAENRARTTVTSRTGEST